MTDNYETQRTIEEVFDLETGEIINSKDFFEKPESEIIEYRRRLQEAINGYSKSKFVCIYCNQLVKLSGISTRRGLVSFFAHLHDSDDCEIKTDGNNLSKEQIEILKYSKIRESERHKYLKDRIYKCLTDDSNALNGVKDVEVEKRIVSKLPYFNWRQPDISFEYAGKKIVLELQLSTTFLSVVVQRDIFYKMNEMFIIWVFNFSENQQYVNLGNLMCKDIYYANKRNAFIFDKEAMELSELKKELILKCVWFEPKIVNGIFDPIKSIIKEEFVSLSDLKFDIDNYKPYYVNADLLFDKYQPSLKVQRQEEEIRIQKSLIKQIILRDVRLTAFKNLQNNWGFKNESGNEVIPAQYSEVLPFNNGISWVRKTYWGAIDTLGHRVVSFQYRGIRHSIHNDYIIATNRKGKSGILSNDGFIIAPIVFDDIKDFVDGKVKVRSHSGWGEIDEHGNPITENKVRVVDNVYKGTQFGLFGFEDRTGNVILPFECNSIEEFINGIARVKKNSKWGVVNQEGKMVFPFEYDSIEEFINGKAIAKKGMETGLIDEKGNELIADKIEIKEGIFKGHIFGKWGIESLDGKIILPFVYDSIGEFSDNNAKAKKGGKWGVINTDGEIIIPYEYDSIDDFIDGKARAQKKYYWGVINTLGETIIPFKYYSIKEFINGKARAKKDKGWGEVNLIGETIIPFEYDSIGEFINGKAIARKNYRWGIINTLGDTLVPFLYDLMEQFIDGKVKVQSNGRWGVINQEGEIVIPLKYSSIGEFIDGKVRAQKAWETGYIDENGNELISNKTEIKEGIFKGHKFGKWGIESFDGKIILPFEYDSIGDFLKGKARAKKRGSSVYINENGNALIEKATEIKKGIFKGCKSGKWGIETFDGKNILPFKYDTIEEFINGIARAKTNIKWGAINQEGEIIIPFEFDSIEEFFDGKAKAKKGWETGYIDEKGNVVIEDKTELKEGIFKGHKFGRWGIESFDGKIVLPFEYDSIEEFIDGNARAKKNSKWGVINQEGNIEIPFEHDSIKEFINGIARATKNRKWGVISQDGKILIPFEYDLIEEFRNGLARATKNSKWGVINQEGEIEIPFEYDSIEEFINGLARAKKISKWGVINQEGKIEIPIEHDSIKEFIDGKAAALKNGKWGHIDKKGNELIEGTTQIKEGIFKGHKFGKWGIEGLDGKNIVPFEYDSIEGFIDGKARANKNGKWGYIDEKGIALITDTSEISEGILLGHKFGKWGVESLDGKNILPFECSSIEKFIDGKAKAKIKNGSWGVINAQGETIIPFEYHSIEEFRKGKARVRKNGEMGYVNEEGIELFDGVKLELAPNIFIGKKFGKYGLEDNNGKVQIPFKYDLIAPYADGKALCFLNGVFKIEYNSAFKPQLYDNKVDGITSFGVFLKIPSLSEQNIVDNKKKIVKGLLHKAEINKAKKQIREFVKGENIKLYIDCANEKKQHISFSYNPSVDKVIENEETQLT